MKFGKTLFVFAFMFCMLVFQSCGSTGYWTEEKCFNCDEFPLNYQEPIVYFGTVTGIHDGTYIESVCLGFDLSLASFTSGSIFTGAHFTVELVTGTGEFCSPNDQSTYRVIVDSPFDAGEESVIVLPGSAFKKNVHSSTVPGTQYSELSTHNSELSSPFVILAGLSLLLAMPLSGATVLNSRTKFGGVALAIITLLQLWLPTLGVEVTPGFWETLFTSLEVISGVLILFGIRDAFYKS